MRRTRRKCSSSPPSVRFSVERDDPTATTSVDSSQTPALSPNNASRANPAPHSTAVGPVRCGLSIPAQRRSAAATLSSPLARSGPALLLLVASRSAAGRDCCGNPDGRAGPAGAPSGGRADISGRSDPKNVRAAMLPLVRPRSVFSNTIAPWWSGAGTRCSPRSQPAQVWDRTR